MKHAYIFLLLCNCFFYPHTIITCEHTHPPSGNSSQSSTPKAIQQLPHRLSINHGQSSMSNNQEWMYAEIIRNAESLPISEIDQITRQKKDKGPTSVLVRQSTTAIGGASSSSNPIGTQAHTPESTDSHLRRSAWDSSYKYPAPDTKIQAIIRSQKLHCCGIVTGLILMTLNIMITIFYSKPCVCKN